MQKFSCHICVEQLFSNNSDPWKEFITLAFGDNEYNLFLQN